jgi:Fur family ferric uptake transcriptional regulator
MLDESAKIRFKEYLQSERQKYTPERLSILEELASEREHFEADDLFIRLKNKGIKVSRATVYRTLDILVRSGIVSKVDFGKNKAYFEYHYGIKHHDHLICIKCSKVVEFEDSTIEKHQERICQQYGFEMTGHSHRIFGLCENCRKKK